MPLQIRRGTTAQRLLITPLPGEPIYDTDLQIIFIGNGVTPGGTSAQLGITTEDAQDAVGQMFVDGVHKNIVFRYNGFQDAANRIDVELDLQNYDGEISASAFRGPIFADDSSLIIDSVTKNIIANSIEGDLKGNVLANNSNLLVDAVNNAINLDGTVKGDVIPDQNELYDLGSNTNRFRDLYLSGNSLYLGSAQLTSVGSTIVLPAGSTIEGVPISAIVEGTNYKINIVSEDSSSIMVNSDTNEFFGDLTGDVTGNLTGDVTGNLTGDVTGSIFADNSSIIINAIDSSINLDGTVKGNVVPDQNELYDLGSNTNRFRDLYLSGNSLNLGAALITAVGSAIELPAGSTVAGLPIGSGSGTGDGVVAGSNYNINIVADDSTFMVNSFSKEFTGTLTGSIFTNLIDSSDSSAITIVPSVTMNSDLLIENDLIVTNLVSAKEFNGRFVGSQYGNIYRADDDLIINHSNGDILGNIINGQELRVSGNASTAVLNLNRTNAGNTAVTTGNEIGQISARGYTGSGFITGTRIISRVRQSIGSGMPSVLDFQVNGTTNNLQTYLSIVGGSGDRLEAYRPLQLFDDAYRPNAALLGLWQYHDTPDATNVAFGRTRGSGTAQAPVQLGDDIADITFLGGNGAGYGIAVSISVVVNDNLSTSNIPGKLIIRTSDGVTSTVERLSIDHLGVTTITGTTNLVGDASVTGSLSADLIGSVFSDTSSMIIDGTDGSVMVANVNFKGQTGNIPLDTVTPDSWLEVTVNGATKYIPLYD